MATTLNLELVKGTSRDFKLLARKVSDGSIPNGFLSTDVLTTKVFAGSGQIPVLSPTTKWFDVQGATYIVAFNDVDTLGLDVATYRVVTTATRLERSAAIGNFSLSILPTYGADLPPKVYCSLADMIPYAPWLDQLQYEQSDLAGFSRQRGDARTWLENIIQKHYRLNAGVGISTFGNSIVSWGPRRLGGDNKILQEFLDQDMLMLGPPRRVVEITAKYAIGLVCQAQITSADARGNFYQQKADYYLWEAQQAVIGYTAEVDINNDGYPEYTIACGTSDALYG